MTTATGSTEGGQTYGAWFRSELVPFQREINAPAEQVLAALPAVFEQLGYPGGWSTRDRNIFMTTQLEIARRLYDDEPNSNFFDCGRTPANSLAADEYRIFFAMLARVTPSSQGSSMVEVVIDGNARSRTLSSTSVNCRGTGRLETAVFQALQQRLAQR